MRLLIILILLIKNLATFGQEKADTVYMKGDKICLKEEAVYYRIITKMENNILYVEDYLINGTLQSIGHYKSLNPEIKEGLLTYYAENGNPTSESDYHENKMNGIGKLFFSSDKNAIKLKANCENGVLNGERIGYYRNGNIKRIETFNNGKMESGKCFTANGSDTAYYPYEIMPSFPGGEEKFFNFLANNVKYPEYEKQNGISGTVYVSFDVDIDGKIINEKIARGVKRGSGLEQEAMRVVKSMPNWIPGSQDGDRVKVQFNLPIKFTLP